MNTREVVLEMLLEVTAGKEYSHIMIKNVLEKYDYLDTVEKAFMKRLFEGTLERMIQIDYVLNSFSKVKVSKMKPVIRNILRMGVYQILFMDAVPDSAACNESVKLAEKKKFHSLKGFVNGILRNVARQKENVSYPDRKKEPILFLSVFYSMPEWVVKAWEKQYGYEMAEKILEGLLKEHDVTLRMSNQLSQEEQEVCLQQIRKQGVEVYKHPYLSYAVTLKGVEGVKNLFGFEEGMWTVQDVSSMLIAEIAGIKKEDTVVDVCAAPGGKTTHLAEKLQGTGCVKAYDISDRKTAQIIENVSRLKLTNVIAQTRDALEYRADEKETADVLLADLPCSGLGIMGKKRDIKYNITQEGIAEIEALQKKILGVIQEYVKPNGILIYSTCTINKAENEAMVEWFLKEYGFCLESIEEYLPKELQKETTKKGYLQLLPGMDECDGFFMARLRKLKETERIKA